MSSLKDRCWEETIGGHAGCRGNRVDSVARGKKEMEYAKAKRPGGWDSYPPLPLVKTWQQPEHQYSTYPYSMLRKSAEGIQCNIFPIFL